MEIGAELDNLGMLSKLCHCVTRGPPLRTAAHDLAIAATAWEAGA